MSEEKKRELTNYGGIVLECPLELMYFKREPHGILFKFELWLSVRSFEQDLPAYPLPELQPFSLQADEFTAFESNFASLIEAADAKIAEICELDLQTRRLDAYEIDAKTKIITATAPKISGGLIDNPKILNDAENNDYTFDNAMQPNKVLISQFGGMSLGFLAQGNSSGFLAKVLQIQVGE